MDRAGLGMYQVMKDRLNCEDLLEGVADSVSIAPGLPFTSMGFTINYAAQPHCDTGDVGPSIIAWVEPGEWRLDAWMDGCMADCAHLHPCTCLPVCWPR